MQVAVSKIVAYAISIPPGRSMSGRGNHILLPEMQGYIPVATQTIVGLSLYHSNHCMKEKATLRQYVEKQMAEITSPFNKWVTGEKVGHDPTHNELAENYIESGAAARFAERYEIEGSL